MISEDYVAVQSWALPIAMKRIRNVGEACGLVPTEEDAKVVIDEAIASLYGTTREIIRPAGLLCTTIKYRVLDRVRAGQTARLHELPVAPDEFPETPGLESLTTGGDGRTLEDQVIDRLVNPTIFAQDRNQIQDLLTDARAAAFMISLEKAYTGESLKDLAADHGLSYGAVRKAAGEARRLVAEHMIGVTGDEFAAYTLSVQLDKDKVPVDRRPAVGAAQLAQSANRAVTPQQYLMLVQSAQVKIIKFQRRTA